MIYSLNTYTKETKKIISNYETICIEINGNICSAVDLEDPYFAVGGYELYIFKKAYKEKKEENQKDSDLNKEKHIFDNFNSEEKEKLPLILKVEGLNIKKMIYLGNKKIICVGNNGIFLIKFNEEYTSSNILFHVKKDKQFKKIIKLNDNHFLTFGEKVPIWKWAINKEENDIEIKFIFNLNPKINDIFKINDKYIACQINERLSILNLKNFQEHLQIKEEDFEVTEMMLNSFINKVTDGIFGAIAKNRDKIYFFDIETGKKINELKINNKYTEINRFITSKRDKEDVDIITICNYCQYHRGNYDIIQDFTLNKNEWENLSENTYYLKNSFSDIIEMSDNSIIIPDEKKLYVLFYPF